MVRETVQRTSETGHTSRERKVRIAQRRTDQVRRVRRDIASFMVAVDDEVQSEELGDRFAVVTERRGEPGGHVRRDRRRAADTVRVLVDAAGDQRQLRRRDLEAGGGVEKNDLSDLRLQVLGDGDVVVATYFVDNRSRSPDGDVSSAKAFETDVWQKIDGAWKIVSLHYSDVGPAE